MCNRQMTASREPMAAERTSYARSRDSGIMRAVALELRTEGEVST
jgi:hypothetical protein